MQMFPVSEVQHILTEESDHQALLVRVATTLADNAARAHRPFMYEAAWARHADYDGMIAAAWEQAHAANHMQPGVGAACKQFGLMAKAMQKWSNEVFGSIKNKLGT